MKFPDYITTEKLNYFIKNALEEDLGGGDYSTLATIPKSLIQKAQLIVKEDCILAGVEIANYIFKYFDESIQIENLIKDGSSVKKGDIAFIVEGKAQSILSTERLILNCMQRMSGIATYTYQMNQLIKDTNCKLLDTRKTTPNFRMLEKLAVLIGGGTNHRFGLYDMIMLKDNHIDYNGSITNAVEMTKKYLKENNLNLKIEVETRNLEEVKEALKSKVDRIMLDNMNYETMKKAVAIIDKQCETEASGGITEKNLRQVSETGVDFISIGALIHSAKNIDLSLKAV
ncbi:MAG: carboxylating nicotinate-nucleotide diphosphorylase [Flavobacteriales bacterium]|nr:carboxylating nicotinate-nucleotide diphosphorylase [Flavobacteriales bacterium]